MIPIIDSGLALATQLAKLGYELIHETQYELLKKAEESAQGRVDKFARLVHDNKPDEFNYMLDELPFGFRPRSLSPSEWSAVKDINQYSTTVSGAQLITWFGIGESARCLSESIKILQTTSKE